MSHLEVLGSSATVNAGWICFMADPGILVLLMQHQVRLPGQKFNNGCYLN